jgi:hypothetical protein
MTLFEGFAGAHGTHGTQSQNAVKGGKMEIKKTARTVREPVTLELWQAHLDGALPLGIIPIREDGTCLWGCIDVDQYDINLGAVVMDLKRRELPMVVCRTKSGGAHAFLFLREPAPAELLRAKLRQISASMGWGESEIFPKQNQILSDRGDLGNWLNMPYLDAKSTVRYGVKESGSGMTLSEFLVYAEERRVTLGGVSDPQKPEDESLDDGPPCLQHLASVGFPEGTRNNGLFGLGTFCKKKYGSRWKEMLEAYNRSYMEPPLPAEEVQRTIQSLEKKEYNYRCKDQPLVSYCNSTLCKMRKFGVGGAGKYPTISGMSKLDAGTDTLWFLDIEDQRIELTTRQLQNYREFQTVCMDVLTVFFLPMKSETWASMVSEAMANATIIEASPEITALGHFMELLDDFCMNSHRGKVQDDLLLGKPWQDEKTGHHYFRLKDLMEFLERRKFDRWGRNVVGRRLEDIGGKTFFNVKGKGVNVYFVPDTFQKAGPADLPKSREVPV